MPRTLRAALWGMVQPTWHRQPVQGAALAYGERVVAEQCIESLNSVDATLKPVLTNVYHLFLLSRIEADLAWFVTEGVLSKRCGKTVPQKVRTLCDKLASSSELLCDGFGIPEHMLYAPIAGDWVAYNEYDNKGEILQDGDLADQGRASA